MELIVKKADLLKNLDMANSVADPKSTMPVLANVLVQTSGDSALLICATNYVVSYSATVPCTVKAEGGFCVPAGELFSVVTGLPGEDIKMTMDGAAVTLRAGRSKYTLRGMTTDLFPKLPDYSDAEFYEVDTKQFGAMLAKTLHSVCKDNVRFHLKGVFFESDGDRVRMVSTDGYRLSKIEFAQEGKQSEGVVIPEQGAKSIRRVIPTKGETLSVAVNAPMFFVRVEGAVMGVKLIDAQFPPYKAVIPLNNDKIVRMNRREAASAFQRVQFASTDQKGIRMHLSENIIRMVGADPKKGTGEEVLDVHYSGDELFLNINPELICDYLTSMDGEEVVMSFSDNTSQILIHTAGKSDYLGVVMPMQPT